MLDLNVYTTAVLLKVLAAQDTFTPFWLNFFPAEMAMETEQILFDLVPRDRRMAPFVAPNVQGRVMKERGSTTRAFKPAYVKPKHEVDPARAIPRQPGEALLGNQSPQARLNAIIANNLQMEKTSITRRWEWMAARAVIDGKVTVSGADYPTVTVDFGRDASLTGVLAGAATWDQSTGDPIGDIEHYRRQVQWLSGTSITRLIFGLDAWKAFSHNPEVLALLNAFNRGSNTDFNTAVGEATPYEYRGTLSGSNGMGKLELYTYSDTYEAEDGTGQLVPYLDSGTVVGVGAGVDGMRLYGAIKDRRAGLAAISMFPKIWDNEDPSVTWTMTQSAPLMVPMQPNASFTLKVCASTFVYPSIFLGYPGAVAGAGVQAPY